MTNTAPDLSTGYPSKGQKLGPAWQELWDKLTDAQRYTDPYLDGRTLADEVAPNHNLNPDTLLALMTRAGRQGILTRVPRLVKIVIKRDDGTSYASGRVRTHYTIGTRP